MQTTQDNNVDSAELTKFSQLAHRWWDPESEFRPLHQINPLRLDWIKSLVSLQGKEVVDIGCGGGILTDAMARSGAHALGADLATKSLKVAQLHALEAQTPNVRYQEISAEALAAERPASFDVVTCMEMLEHVPDPSSTVAACAAHSHAFGQYAATAADIDDRLAAETDALVDVIETQRIDIVQRLEVARGIPPLVREFAELGQFGGIKIIHGHDVGCSWWRQ